MSLGKAANLNDSSTNRFAPTRSLLASTVFEPDSGSLMIEPISSNTQFSLCQVAGSQTVYQTPGEVDPSAMPANENLFQIVPEDRAGNPAYLVLNDGASDAAASGYWPRFGQPIVHNLVSDEVNFYGCSSLEWLAVGIGGAAILANTNLDEQFRQAVGGPGGAGSHDLDWMKEFGTGNVVIPALVGIWAIDYFLDVTGPTAGSPCVQWITDWSGRSLRGLIVGAVPLLSLQYIIGSSALAKAVPVLAGSRSKTIMA